MNNLTHRTSTHRDDCNCVVCHPLERQCNCEFCVEYKGTSLSIECILLKEIVDMIDHDFQLTYGAYLYEVDEKGLSRLDKATRQASIYLMNKSGVVNVEQN